MPKSVTLDPDMWILSKETSTKKVKRARGVRPTHEPGLSHRRKQPASLENRLHVRVGPDEQPLLYLRGLNTSNIGTGPPLVTTVGITPFHFSTARP